MDLLLILIAAGTSMAMEDFEEFLRMIQVMSAKDRRTRVVEITGAMVFAVALLVAIFITR